MRDDNDNKLYKNTFTFIGYKFFLTAKTQYTMPAEPEKAKGVQIAQNASDGDPEAKPSLTDRLKNLMGRFRNKKGWSFPRFSKWTGEDARPTTPNGLPSSVQS